MYSDREELDEALESLASLLNDCAEDAMQALAEFFESIFRYCNKHYLFPKDKFRPLILKRYETPIMKHKHLPYLQQIYNGR